MGLVFLALILIILLISLFCIKEPVGTSYEVKDGHFVLRNPFRTELVDIPIDKIRVIEVMANKRQGIRIVYNKFDDLYVKFVDSTKLIKDLQEVNPDIEIRKELA